ncbi:unnamed protein product [Phytomonas sp. Hart1]|nr:unnamed protein product [Phytomonas sp. Hart1]|eukprot:CCW66498.1 unnamed protein product [Phytomonas sp. isolate Hart1]
MNFLYLNNLLPAEQVGLERPRWNTSMRDEAHPFPERPHMHVNTRYNGVEVVSTHFPETIKGTAYFRLPNSSKPRVWETNRMKARSLNRSTFQCPSLQEEDPPMSYLAMVVIDDNSNEKRGKEQHWCASTALERHRESWFVRPKPEPDYVKMNAKKPFVNTATYISPMRRAEEDEKRVRRDKQQQLEASQFTPLTLYKRSDCPDVFKMSNIDEWCNIDTVKVAKERAALRATLQCNPYNPLSTVPRK